MSAGQPFYLRSAKTFIGLCLLASMFSCTVVKSYQPEKPFVYETNINLIGNFTNEEKTQLVDGLEGQLEDSMRARKRDMLFWKVLKGPPRYDSTNAEKSIIFMRALLVSLGYFGDSIGYHDTIVVRNKDQYRAIIRFDVKPGKQHKLDSIRYSINHPELQRLADSTMSEAFIKKGDPFAKVPISAEFDRLTELFRNNGYLRFSRDELVGVWDTLDIAMLQPSLDPFEQLEFLQRLRERRERPTANLVIRLRNTDSTKLVKYYNGKVTVYPDHSVDTIGLKRQVDVVKDITVIQHRNKFKPRIFPPNIYLPRGAVYSQRRYLRTINRLNLLGAWRLVNIEAHPRRGEDTVDFIARLTPAKKYSFSTNLEGSINQSAVSGTLFGLGINVGLQNRNFAKAANLATMNLRYGVEFGNSGSDQFIQTQQASISHNIIFPRAIIFDKWIKQNRKDNFRTIFSINGANTERRFLYNLTTLNGSWGYEYQRGRMLLNIKLPNVEYSFLSKRDSLRKLIQANPALNNIFTDGFIFSSIVNLTLTGGKGDNLNLFRANLEGSPLIAGFFKSNFLDSHLYRFVKFDVEFARLIRYAKTSIALRFFAGVGVADPFNTTRNHLKEKNLPFFKQYFSGGPNSMRAWALRRLGPGSTIKAFDGTGSSPDRYGDVQLEANAEYRFPLGRPWGIIVNGAVFTDIGNVWLLKEEAGTPEQVFKFGTFVKDLAVGAGAGLRIDLNFFVIRFDYSYKVKDPSPRPADAIHQNKWFSYPFFKGDQFQLGINYPFVF